MHVHMHAFISDTYNFPLPMHAYVHVHTQHISKPNIHSRTHVHMYNGHAGFLFQRCNKRPESLHTIADSYFSADINTQYFASSLVFHRFFISTLKQQSTISYHNILWIVIIIIVIVIVIIIIIIIIIIILSAPSGQQLEVRHAGCHGLSYYDDINYINYDNIDNINDMY